MKEQEGNIRDVIVRRSWIVGVLILLVFCFAVFRMVKIQNWERKNGLAWIDFTKKTIRDDITPSQRGNIYSSDGSLLATSLPYYEMSLDPMIKDSVYFKEKIDSLAMNLAETFHEKTKDEYVTELKFARHEKDRDVRLVKRLLTLKEHDAVVKDWPFFRVSNKVKIAKGGKMKVIYSRVHPFEGLAERTIGGIDAKTKKGFRGIEEKFDTDLTGTPGMGYKRILDDGSRMATGDGEQTDPVPGYDVYCNIDMNFQDIAETALKKTLKKYQADFGCAVVMEVKTGAIKANANLKRESDSVYKDTYNYAVAHLAHPGSTFKTATMLAVLDKGVLTPTNTVETGSGFAQYNRVKIRDTHGNGTLSVADVLVKSSNVGIHQLMLRSGFYKNHKEYIDYLQRFGLRNRSKIDMLGEAIPIVHGPDTDFEGRKRLWNAATSPTFISYGYEWELTPLQMLTFYNAVANDGIWVRPRILDKIQNTTEVKHTEPIWTSQTRFCKTTSIQKIKTMLEDVVLKGTAKNISDTPYGIAGKTGTAQIYGAGGYMEGRYNVSFVGYFPVKNPKYSCIVWVSYPKGGSSEERFAGSVAAPPFKEIADRIVGYDVKMHPNMPQQQNKYPALVSHFKNGQSEDLKAIAQDLNIDSVPEITGWAERKGKAWKTQDIDKLNVLGMSLRDALYLLENKGHKVTYRGKGKVKEVHQKNGIYTLILG